MRPAPWRWRGRRRADAGAGARGGQVEPDQLLEEASGLLRDRRRRRLGFVRQAIGVDQEDRRRAHHPRAGRWSIVDTPLRRARFTFMTTRSGVARPRPPSKRLTAPWLTPAVSCDLLLGKSEEFANSPGLLAQPLDPARPVEPAAEYIRSQAMGLTSSRAREGLSIQKVESALQEVTRDHDPLDLAVPS